MRTIKVAANHIKNAALVFTMLALFGCSQDSGLVQVKKGKMGKQSAEELERELGIKRYVVPTDSTNLTQIAYQNKVTVRELAKLNNLVPPYHLTKGQIIKVPEPVYHQVQADESMESIAALYNVSQQSIASVNNLIFPYNITPGQKLRIPYTTKVAFKDKQSQGKDITFTRREGVASASADFKDINQPEDSEKIEVMSVTPADDTPIASMKVDDTAKIFNPEATKLPASIPPIEPPDVPPFTPVPEVVESTHVSAQKAPSSASIPHSTFKLGWPVKGEVVARYGDIIDGVKNDGINISAPLGATVTAAEKGSIIYAGNDPKNNFGNLVIVKHENGMFSAYAHLESIKVSKGGTINKGQAIGNLGQTGKVSSPQLHFSIRKNKISLDPESLL